MSYNQDRRNPSTREQRNFVIKTMKPHNAQNQGLNEVKRPGPIDFPPMNDHYYEQNAGKQQFQASIGASHGGAKLSNTVIQQLKTLGISSNASKGDIVAELRSRKMMMEREQSKVHQEMFEKERVKTKLEEENRGLVEELKKLAEENKLLQAKRHEQREARTNNMTEEQKVAARDEVNKIRDMQRQFRDKVQEIQELKAAYLFSLMQRGGDVMTHEGHGDNDEEKYEESSRNRRGFTDDQIKTLRLKPFDPQEESNAICPICCKEYYNREPLTCLPCTHQYHKECIKDWLSRERKCPICHDDVQIT